MLGLTPGMNYNKLMPIPKTADEFHHNIAQSLDPADFFTEAKEFLAGYAGKITTVVIKALRLPNL